jgi:hypothetical protein
MQTNARSKTNGKSLLLLVSLEASVAELGGSVDKLEVDLLQGLAGCAWVHALAESHHSLVCSNCASLDHQEVVLDQPVVGKATEGVDALLCKVVCR